MNLKNIQNVLRRFCKVFFQNILFAKALKKTCIKMSANGYEGVVVKALADVSE